MHVITAVEAERQRLELISKQDIWAICRKLPDLFVDYDVVAVVLFGSRARCDQHIDSDIDIAVIMRGCSPWSSHSKRLSRELFTLTYPIELETGLSINSLPVPIEYMRDPKLSKNPELYENIRRDGLIFWELGEHLDPPSGWHVSHLL